MGFVVDEYVDWPSGHVPGEVEHHEQRRWAEPYARYQESISCPSGVADVAREHRRIWTDAVMKVADGQAALVISSGGAGGPALVARLPDAEHAAWGAPLGHCEGARLGFDQGQFAGVEFARTQRVTSQPPADRI